MSVEHPVPRIQAVLQWCCMCAAGCTAPRNPELEQRKCDEICKSFELTTAKEGDIAARFGAPDEVFELPNHQHISVWIANQREGIDDFVAVLYWWDGTPLTVVATEFPTWTISKLRPSK